MQFAVALEKSTLRWILNFSASTLASVQEGLAPGDVLLACLDDVFAKTLPARVGAVYASVDGELFRHAGIRLHGGKTRVWNSAGTRPLACDILEQIAQATSDHAEPVW